MCWTLTVVMTSMPASSSSSTSCQRFSLREPGAFVWASSSTSASCGRRARTASRSISLERRRRGATTVRRGTHRKPLRLRGGRRAAVGLDDRDDDVAALAEEAPPLLEHRVGLADAGRGAEQHPQPPALHRVDHPSAAVSLSASSARLSSSTLTVRLAEEAEVAGLDRSTRRGRGPRPRRGRGPAATRSTCSSAYAGLMCGSRPEAEAVTASAGISDSGDAVEVRRSPPGAPRSRR